VFHEDFNVSNEQLYHLVDKRHSYHSGTRLLRDLLCLCRQNKQQIKCFADSGMTPTRYLTAAGQKGAIALIGLWTKILKMLFSRQSTYVLTLKTLPSCKTSLYYLDLVLFFPMAYNNMQIDAAAWIHTCLKYNAFASIASRCSEIDLKCLNMQQVCKFLYFVLLNICTNDFAA